ncbi:MAG TPA: site-specific tyrosine recombinase XerD [Saprospiraceae bacterium]|nr:site-specific tyrosine recombinase XerD [Saprospiraceae bacterium]HMQ85071.1 site-specific tyrosine recombinase XerD [Saprospiraceae bacterium]
MTTISKDWFYHFKGFEGFLLLERSLSVQTVAAYLADMEKLLRFLEIHHIAADVTTLQTNHIEQMLGWLNEMGLADRSQARLLSALKTFYKYLILEEITDKDPCALIDGPKLSRKIPAVLTYEEIQAMIQSIDLSHPQGTRNRAILETLYACGLRVSELTQLRISNLYLDIGFVKVQGKGNKERIVPIGEEAIKHIQLYQSSDRSSQMNIQKGFENHLFLNNRGKALSRVMVFLIIKELAAAAGIQKNVSPHTFRHSFATHLIEGGADLKAVQDMLGHESITTTEIYTHLDTDFLRSTIMQFHPRSLKK